MGPGTAISRLGVEVVVVGDLAGDLVWDGGECGDTLGEGDLDLVGSTAVVVSTTFVMGGLADFCLSVVAVSAFTSDFSLR